MSASPRAMRRLAPRTNGFPPMPSGNGAGDGNGNGPGEGDGSGDAANGDGTGANSCGTGNTAGCPNPSHGGGGHVAAGDPIDPATGRVFTAPFPDLVLSGPLPSHLLRAYSSCSTKLDVGLGWGWSHTPNETRTVGAFVITRDANAFCIVDGSGQAAAHGEADEQEVGQDAPQLA